MTWYTVDKSLKQEPADQDYSSRLKAVLIHMSITRHPCLSRQRANPYRLDSNSPCSLTGLTVFLAVGAVASNTIGSYNTDTTSRQSNHLCSTSNQTQNKLHVQYLFLKRHCDFVIPLARNLANWRSRWLMSVAESQWPNHPITYKLQLW